MAKKKTTIDDLREVFDKCRPLLNGGNANLLPMSGDETKCVLVAGDSCQTYSCYAMKGHLEFVLATVGR